MVRSLLLVVAVAVPSALVVGQQTGDPNRDYTVNGAGSGGTSYVTSTVLVPSAPTNTYSTLDANMPVVWATAPTGFIGWLTTPVNSVDVGPVGLLFIGDGTDPTNPLHPLMSTDPSGTFQITLLTPASLAGQTLYFAMAHASPLSPDGFFVSQTHRTTFIADPNLGPSSPACNPAGTPQVLGDDASVQVSLGFTFMFYGVSYTDIHIGSNGYITFGVGETAYSESVSGLLGNAPRIAMWWDDLNPSSGGTITYHTDNAGVAEVCFQNVPEFVNTGANSFRVTLFAAGVVTVDYGSMTAADGIAGLSPGNGLDPTGLPVDLSIGPNSIPPGMAVYQRFTSGSPNDLAGFQVNYALDPSGNPTAQF